MAWGAFWPASPGDDIQATLFTHELDKARIERLHVTTGSADGPGGYQTDGDDLQSITPYAAVQGYINGSADRYIDSSTVYDRDGAPLDTSLWDFTTAELRSAAGLHVDGFKCVYPREILSTASTADTDGVAAADGQFALHRDQGWIYERVAGAWVLRGPPGPFQADRKTRYGTCAVGDYLTEDPAIFNEAKDAIDLLRWQCDHARLSTRMYQEYAVGNATFLDISWEDSKGQGETVYFAGVTAVSPGGGYFNAEGGILTRLEHSAYTGGGYVQSGGDAPEWEARPAASRAKYEMYLPAGTVTIAWQAEVLTYAKAPDRAADNPSDEAIFDANGVTVITENDWHLFEATAVSTADKITDWIGRDPAAYLPNWCSDPESVATSDGMGLTEGTSSRGYQLAGRATIIKWDQAGGLTKV